MNPKQETAAIKALIKLHQEHPELPVKQMTREELLKHYPDRWTQVVQLKINNLADYHDLNELDTWEFAAQIVKALIHTMDTEVSAK